MECNFFPVSSLSSLIKHQLKEVLAFLVFTPSVCVKNNYILPSQPSFCWSDKAKLFWIPFL